MEVDNKKKLINEKIVGRRLTPRRALKIVGLAAVCGVVFGLASSCTYNLFHHDQEETIAETSVEETSPAEVETTIGETENAGSGEENQNPGDAASGTEVNPDGIQLFPGDTALMDAAEFKEEIQKELTHIYADAAELVKPSLVTISATSTTTTWFESETEKTEYYSGVILSADKHEILILSVCTDTDGKKLKVSFSNGSTSDAYVKQTSLTDKLIVLAVSATEGISEETIAGLKPVQFSNITQLSEGDMIVAAGSPYGVSGSNSFGQIGFLGEEESGIDCVQNTVYSDIVSNAQKGSFIMDLAGDLVGVVCDAESEIGIDAKYTRVVTAASLRKVIDSLSTGSKLALLGIKGESVNFEMKYNNIPEGVYVEELIQNGPAYNAGIHRGDVIVEIYDRKITDMSSLSRAVSSFKADDEVSIKVMRNSGNNEYSELEMNVVFGER